MSGGRTRAVVLLAAATAGAVFLSCGPKVVELAERFGDARRAPAPVAGGLAPEPRWVTPVTGWPSALAADDRGAVVVAGGGEVRALDASGDTRWRVDVAGAALQPPAIDRARAVVGTGARVVALDRRDGSTRWEATIPSRFPNPVALAADLAFAGTEEGALVALDAGTGEVRWSVAFGGSIRTAPVVDRDTGVVAATWHGGESPRLRALDLRTGAVRWEAPLLPFASGPVASAGMVVVGEGDGEYAARIVARALADGAEVWSVSAPASFESGITPGAAGDDVAVVDHFGTVSVVDVHTGALRARTELGEPVLRTTVLVDGDEIVLTTHRGSVVTLDRATGDVLHRGGLGGYPAGIARAGDALLVALRLREPGRVEALPL